MRSRSLLLWWAPSTNTSTSALHRLLLPGDGPVPDHEVAVPGDDAALQALRRRAARGAGEVDVEVVRPRPPAALPPSGAPVPELEVAVLDRPLDTDWRRTSYSALTAAAHEPQPAVASEPEQPQTDDEADADDDVRSPASDDALRAIPSPWAEPAGRHRVRHRRARRPRVGCRARGERVA
ncbi:hypothetical protein GCM10025868_24730 [Angustibacter aerolatus]|uniref:Uncharacterized protein n=1 Tax=Angustibacter aerolatus TaxID=1162965 RepID=A0ABQ6JGB6_9ACTN|nr:hypothetical protein [Angustibacter aerolatus]GMA87223.1 hypothetical protein GCM10025868_24730 [Angustibacter aerolatus]